MTITTFTTSDGCDIAVERTGLRAGETVIFSNSLGADRSMWDAQASALESTYDVVRYDTRGHGASSAPQGAYSIDRLALDVLEMTAALGLEGSHYCGLSLGGMVGQALAARAPDQFRSMIFSTTSSYMGPPEGWQSRIETVLAEGMNAIAGAVVARWLTPVWAKQHPQTAQHWQDKVKNTSAAGYAGCCAAIRDMDLRPLSALNTLPTLVIVGRCDEATPLPHGRQIVENASQARLVEVDGAHLPNLENPEIFNTILLDFLAQNEASK